MTQEPFPQPDQPPISGDFVPQPTQDVPSGTEYMAPEALEELAKPLEAAQFSDLPNESKVMLYRTDRFNHLQGRAVLPALQEYIDSPDSDISRAAFDRDFSGELSPRGFLLDPEGNETIHRPDSISRFRVDPDKEIVATETAYQKYLTEQGMAKAVDEAAQEQDAAPAQSNGGHDSISGNEKPSIESQKELLLKINEENAQKLLQEGLIEKAQKAYLEEVKEVGQNLLAYAAPEAIDETIQNHAEQGTSEIEETLNPDNYTVSHQVSSDMSEHYSVTYSKRRNILVGSTVIDPENGNIRTVPSEGFTEAQVELVREMTLRLEKLRQDGRLPDLTADLQWIHDTDTNEHGAS